MKAQVRGALIIACTAGAIAITIAPMITPAPPDWSEPLRGAGIVLTVVGMATILTNEE